MSEKYYYVISFFLLLSLAACDSNLDNKKSISKPGSGENAFFQVSLDPCDVALAPQADSKVSPDRRAARGDVTHYQRAVIQSETPIPRLENLGWAYIARARTNDDSRFYKLAEQTALCIESKQVNSPEALLLHGHALHNLHKFEQAEILANKLVKQRGLWFDYGLLGDVLMERGRLDEAVVAYQVMLDQRPGPQGYGRAAQVRWIKGDIEGAIEMMALMISAQGNRDRESVAWAQTRLAYFLVQKNNLDKANVHIDRALQSQMDYPPALLLRGRVQLAQGDSETAVKTLSRVAQHNSPPGHQWALIEALRVNGRFEAAEKIESSLSSRGVMEDPRTVAIYLATTGKDVQRALALARKELLARADVTTLDTVAWAFHAIGDTQKAREYSKRALLEGTIDARLLLHGAVIASASGEKKSAAALFNKVIVIQHMLLPSEQKIFLNEFAIFQSKIPMPDLDKSTHQNQSII